MSRPDWIEVGRIVRPHGVRGEVRISAESDNPERFAPGAVLHARPGQSGLVVEAGEHIRLTIEAVRGDDDFPIVAFREIGDRDQAEALRGFVLEIPADLLPELGEDEFYPFDLEGLAVRDPAGEVVGRVVEVLDYPAHGVLVIAIEGKGTHMVPFVAEAVPTVRVAEGYLVVESRFLAPALE
ncbi:MAG: ribosome maturation factor RimM [Thermoleophilia bacterium]|nr:ribosome maturation factor RimM [Thermoleophilia bacterium]